VLEVEVTNRPLCARFCFVPSGILSRFVLWHGKLTGLGGKPGVLCHQILELRSQVRMAVEESSIDDILFRVMH
jgi:hypothetical protein